jgi:hypothetical protein
MNKHRDITGICRDADDSTGTKVAGGVNAINKLCTHLNRTFRVKHICKWRYPSVHLHISPVTMENPRPQSLAFQKFLQICLRQGNFATPPAHSGPATSSLKQSLRHTAHHSFEEIAVDVRQPAKHSRSYFSLYMPQTCPPCASRQRQSEALVLAAEPWERSSLYHEDCAPTGQMSYRAPDAAVAI